MYQVRLRHLLQDLRLAQVLVPEQVLELLPLLAPPLLLPQVMLLYHQDSSAY